MLIRALVILFFVCLFLHPNNGECGDDLVVTIIAKRNAQSDGAGRYLSEYEEVIALPPLEIIALADRLTSEPMSFNLRSTASSIYAVGCVKLVLSQNRNTQSYDQMLDEFIKRQASVEKQVRKEALAKSLSVLLPSESFERLNEVEELLTKKAAQDTLIAEMLPMLTNRQQLDSIRGDISFDAFGYSSLFSSIFLPDQAFFFTPDAVADEDDSLLEVVRQHPEAIPPSDLQKVAKQWYELHLREDDFGEKSGPYHSFRRSFMLWRNLSPTGEDEEANDRMIEPLLSDGLGLIARDMLKQNSANGSAKWPDQLREEFKGSLTPRETAFLAELAEFGRVQINSPASEGDKD